MPNRRRRTRANRAVKITTTKELRPFVPTPAAMQRVQRVPKVRKARKSPRRFLNKNKATLARCTAAGVDMLKCAFASPDFGIDPGQGIVDKFQGRVINIKDAATASIVFEENHDTFIVVLPIPGYQYFIGVAPIGSVPVDFVGVPYSTYETNFGVGSSADNKFTRFRYAGGSSGIYPTSNMMQFAGSIQAWRIDANMCETLFDAVKYDPATVFRTQKVNAATADPAMGTFSPAGTSGTQAVQINFTGPDTGLNRVTVAEHAGEPEVDTYMIPAISSIARNAVQRSITGLASITSLSPRDSYNDSFIKGAFAVMTDRTDDFEWTDFTTADNYTDGDLRISSDGTHPLKGLGNLNGTVYKISTPAGAVNSALIKTWACLEMQPNTNSNLYQFSKKSPMYDPIAMQLYHDYASYMPVAVPCAQNGISWETFLRYAERALSIAGKYAPVVGQGLTWASQAVGLINSLVF